MATWQASFLLIPHQRAVEYHSALFASKDPIETEVIEWWPELLDQEIDWWSKAQPVPGFREALDALAPRLPSWSPNVEWWGRAEDSDRFDVYTEDARVTELLARFDMREPDERFIQGIGDLASDLGCDFLGFDGCVVDGSPYGLSLGLRNSQALRFVRDPLGFLQRLALGGLDEG